MAQFKNVWVDILSIGDELLIGQTVNTNASWLGMKCNQLGVQVRRIIAIPDNREAIIREIETSLREAQVTFITGGLGPTKDDITKKTIADFFDDELVRDMNTYLRVQAFFAKRNLPLLESNDGQSMVPSKCTVIPNYQGTAPGMWMEQNGHVLISMPGVPYEMQAMVEETIIPLIQKKFEIPTIIHQTLMTIGAGESFIAEQLKDFENEIEEDGISLAYLPSPGSVKLRLSKYGVWDKEEVSIKIKERATQIQSILGQIVFSDREMTIYKKIAELCQSHNKTLSVAESCTGGALQSAFTAEAGASNFFKGGTTAYWVETKVDILDIDKNLIDTHGIVSEQVAMAMAQTCQKKMNTDFAIATTGYAGPDSPDPSVPVGTICVAVSNGDSVFAKTLHLGNNRQRNIQNTCLQAANLLRTQYFNN
jgi:nicotinamide-nucleotide amidase